MNTKTLAIAGSLLSLAAGVGVGHLITKKVLRDKYEEIAEQEIAAAKVYYSALYKVGDEYATPGAFLEKRHPGMTLDEETKASVVDPVEVDTDTLERVVQGLKYHRGAVKPIVTQNIFLRGDEQPQAPQEEPTAEKPYIIAFHEYDEQTKGYVQETLTYFTDGALTDESDMVIDTIDEVVGLANLQWFGRKSPNPNVVYIRNEKLEKDFEVVRSIGTYAADVLGFVEVDED